jgi:hypothetical protein
MYALHVLRLDGTGALHPTLIGGVLHIARGSIYIDVLKSDRRRARGPNRH